MESSRALKARARKKAESEVSAAEKTFQKDWGSFPRQRTGRCLGHNRISAALAQNLAILQIQNRRWDSAGKSVALLVKSCVFQPDASDTPLEKAVAVVMDPSVIYGVAAELSRVQAEEHRLSGWQC